MLKNHRIKAVSTFLSLGLLCSSSEAHRVRHPDSVQDLITDIIIANYNHEDDVIDLGGRTFWIQTVNNTSTNGSNALPVIGPDRAVTTPHSLTIKNGTIEISLLSGLYARHFEVALGATLYLENVTLKYGNSEADGGSIYNAGTVGTKHVAFIANYASGDGGAIYNDGNLNVGSSTFHLNAALGTEIAPGIKSLRSAPPGGNGGAIYNNAQITNLYNSTFANNTAHFDGGAINTSTSTSAIITMTNNTIAANIAEVGYGGGIFVTDENDLSTSATSPYILTFFSNIVAGNTANFGGPDINDLPNFVGVDGIINAQYNLVGLGDTGNGNHITASNNNLVGTTSALDPGLEQLADNGGPVWTMALADTSLAINTGYNYLQLRHDERGNGYVRTSGGATDIGAYELQICGRDSDHDGVCNENDNCPCRYNPDQADCNHNGVGDVCDECPCPDDDDHCDDTCGPCPPDNDGPCDPDDDDHHGSCPHDGDELG